MTDYNSDGHIFNKTVTIIGIDPGASGAMSFTKLEWLGGKIKPHKIDSIKCHPLIAGRRVGISMAIHAFKSDKIIAYIEKVHAMPHDGRSSLFKFGMNYGVWLIWIFQHCLNTHSLLLFSSLLMLFLWLLQNLLFFQIHTVLMHI